MMQQVRQTAQPAAPPDEQIEQEHADEPGDEVLQALPRMCPGRRKDCQPRRQYMRVGGRCSHIE